MKYLQTGEREYYNPNQINYLHHFNVIKAQEGSKIDWKERFRDNPDGPKEIENWPSFSQVMDGVSYMIPRLWDLSFDKGRNCRSNMV